MLSGKPRSIRYKLNWVVLVTTAALSFNDPRTALQNLAMLKARPNINAAAIYDPDGHVFATFPLDLAVQPLPATQHEGVQVVIKRIVDETGHVGTVYLRARHERLDRLQRYLAVIGVVIAASLALALLLSNWLLSVVTRPLLAVSDVARRTTTGRDYSLRATRTTDDEVGQVVDAFNEMLAELARRAEILELAHQETLDLNAELEARVRRRTAQLEPRTASSRRSRIPPRTTCAHRCKASTRSAACSRSR